jgi:hypothetical protein
MTLGRFCHFVAIDWSGAKGRRQKGIAIAHCALGDSPPTLVRPGHRWSRDEVLAWLLGELPDDSLVGLDLSPGLPFDDEGAYFPSWSGTPGNAKELWRLIDDHGEDGDHLSAAGFLANPEVRRHFRLGKGECGDQFTGGAGRMRRTEERQREHRLNPSSCFNLVGAAQVGKSSLTGMRVLHQLGGALPIWPFDDVPAKGSVIVEIYTSLAARTAGVPAGRAKMRGPEALDAALAELTVGNHEPLPHYSDHATDAILTSAWLRKVADDPALWSPLGLAKVAQTEGWTFGVR